MSFDVYIEFVSLLHMHGNSRITEALMLQVFLLILSRHSPRRKENKMLQYLFALTQFLDESPVEGRSYYNNICWFYQRRSAPLSRLSK
jgi:hypothetical protein